AERARLRRLLQGEQVEWHAGRRGHRRGCPWDEVEPGNHAAGAHGHKRRCLLPPWLPDGTHGYHFPPSAVTVLFAVISLFVQFRAAVGRGPPPGRRRAGRAPVTARTR